MNKKVLVVFGLISFLYACGEAPLATNELTKEQKLLMSRMGDEATIGNGQLIGDADADLGSGGRTDTRDFGNSQFIDSDGDLNEDGVQDIGGNMNGYLPEVDGDGDWNADGDTDFGDGTWINKDGDINDDGVRDIGAGVNIDLDGDWNNDGNIDVVATVQRDPNDPYQNVRIGENTIYNNGEYEESNSVSDDWNNDQEFDFKEVLGQSRPFPNDKSLSEKITMTVDYLPERSVSSSDYRINISPDCDSDSVKYEFIVSGTNFGSNDDTIELEDQYSWSPSILLSDDDRSDRNGSNPFDVIFMDYAYDAYNSDPANEEGVEQGSKYLMTAYNDYGENDNGWNYWNITYKNDDEDENRFDYKRISIVLDYWPDGVGNYRGPSKGFFRYVIKGWQFDQWGGNATYPDIEGGANYKTYHFGGPHPMQIVGVGVFQRDNWVEYEGDMSPFTDYIPIE